MWERGGGSGHLFNLSTIVNTLVRGGHAVSLSVKDPCHTRSLLGGYDIVIAPLAATMHVAAGTGMARSYAELLFNLGFGNKDELARYLRSWRRFLIEVGPTAVFCDHADGALLAAYSLGIPALVIGNGFFHPPAVSPFPAFELGFDMDVEGLPHVEGRVLESMNSALKEFGRHPIGSLAEFYAYPERIVVSFPELDCYGVRDGVEYLGALGPTQTPAEPVWKGAGEKIFCYFTRGRGPNPDFVRQLLSEGFSLLIAAPGLDEGEREALCKQGVAVEGSHVDLEQVCAQCRLVFSEGNHATTSTILRYGRVPILLPRQVEQLATANRLAVQSLGVLPDRSMQGPIYLELIDRLEREPGYERNARSFSKRYRAWDEHVCAGKVQASVENFIGM
jgi:hypothetical protein